MINLVKNSVLAVLYPRECAVCGNSVEDERDGIACGACWSNTRIFSDSDVRCVKCGAFLPKASADIKTSCRECEEHHFDKAGAVGVYEGALAASILRLKKTPHIGNRLRDLLSEAVNTPEFAAADLIIPVPLSKRRSIERGFNQAEIIARHVSIHTGIRVDSHTVARTRHAKMHRIGMDGKAREATVRNAFEILRPKLIDGKRILLVDDVLTSGATASQCAKALKKSGAAQIYVFTIARAILRR